MKVVISNEKELKQKLKSFNKNNFHVISDFDRTLTHAFVDGQRVNSTYAILREGKYFAQSYIDQEHVLFDEYYPYEVSTELSDKEKYIKMEEWWYKHFELMVKHGISTAVIKDCAKNKKLRLRKGAAKLFDFLKKHNIPMLIFSAGLGDIIKEFLKNKRKLTSNLHLISNFFNFDEDGKVISYNPDAVHVFNKHEYEIQGTPYHKEVSERKNVILLGDSLGDLGMAEGLEHDTIIRIGFLNDNKDRFLEKYKEEFDVVILDDGEMDYVNELLGKIIK